ncbi:hypothetical protein AHAS_Ahas15G0281900 [Arachis hypogaea]
MQTFPIFHLTSLDSEDCWSLLAEHAFGANNSSERSNLEGLGREIVKKCDGLPLAAVALGVFFASNCRKMIGVRRLVHVSKTKKILEEVGDEYFDELVSKSLIRRQSMDGKRFEMHDLINDLAAMVLSAYCVRYEDQKALENPNEVPHFTFVIQHKLGKLCISKLQNIVNPCDASQANMKKKEQIEDLSLEWDSCTAQESQHLVLEHLQPSTNLKKLTIKFYGGTWFPKLNVTELESFPHLGLPTPKLRRFWVSYCNKLNSLPEPVNALVGLQELTVLNLPSMQFFANEGLPINTFPYYVFIISILLAPINTFLYYCRKLFVNHACGVVGNLL